MLGALVTSFPEFWNVASLEKPAPLPRFGWPVAPGPEGGGCVYEEGSGDAGWPGRCRVPALGLPEEVSVAPVAESAGLIFGGGQGWPTWMSPQSSQSHIGSLKSLRAERGCVCSSSFNSSGKRPWRLWKLRNACAYCLPRKISSSSRSRCITLVTAGATAIMEIDNSSTKITIATIV